MGTLAEATGGVFYHNNNDFNAGFREWGGEPPVTYRLSFRPEGAAPDGRYQKLKVSFDSLEELFRADAARLFRAQ